MTQFGYRCRLTTYIGMDLFVTLTMTLLMSFLTTAGALPTTTSAPITREYCQSENFDVSCPHGQAILMESAQYGRMEKGRCVTEGYGSMGCSVDVLHYLDSKCSGRSNCTIYIADPTLHKLRTCPKDLTSYLKATYSCVTVQTGSPSSCRRNALLKVTSTSGYLSSYQATIHGFGTAECPWEVRAEAGQKVKFSLMQFGPGKVGDDNRHRSSAVGACYELGTITDGDEKPTITSCGVSDREKVFYTSTKSKVVVQFKPKEVMKDLSPFFLKYEAIGCPSLTAPRGGTVEVTEKDTATIKCNNSDEIWSLACIGTKWQGQLGNCSQAVPGWTLETILQNEEKFPFGILIVVAIGVALGVFFGGILLSLAAVYMKRKHRPYQNPAELRRDIDETYQEHKQYMDEHQHPGTLVREGHYRVAYPDPGQYCPRHEGAYAKDSGFSGSHTIPVYTGSASTKSGHVYESPQFS